MKLLLLPLILANGLKENWSLKHIFIKENKFLDSNEAGEVLRRVAQSSRGG